MLSTNWLLCSVAVIGLMLDVSYAADVDQFLDVSEPDVPGRLYVPPEADDSMRPVILFLHGAGESGRDNRLQINSNVNNLFAAAKERGAFLYAPQAVSPVGGIFNWNDRERTDTVITKIDQILAEYNADPNRVYVTGLSMGGGGTWNMVDRYSDRFAAAVPIAGVRAHRDLSPANLLDTPIWAFHARDDAVVPESFSRRMVDAILEAGGEQNLEYPGARDRTTIFEYSSDTPPLKYTEFARGGHGIWGQVYGRADLHDWMFAQSVPEPSSGQLVLLSFVSWAFVLRRRTRKASRI